LPLVKREKEVGLLAGDFGAFGGALLAETQTINKFLSAWQIMPCTLTSKFWTNQTQTLQMALHTMHY